MHTMGFVHEHNRFDRDQYVTVDINKVSTQSRRSFQKKDTWNINPYDLESVTHSSLMVRI